MMKLGGTFQKQKGKIAASCILIICAIGWIFLTRGNPQDIRQLTQAEIDEVNQALEQLIPSDDPNYEFKVNPICHFFTSHYDKPEDINLEQFIWYLQGIELYADIQEDAEQFEALKKLDGFPFQDVETLGDMVVPLQRKPLKAVDDILYQYAGIHVQDLKGMEQVLYLSAPYDSFYTYTTDFAAGYFTCNGGETEGDTVRLFSDHAVLTLEKKYDKYLIVSHLEAEKA